VDAADPGDTVDIAAGEYEGPVVMYPADSLISIIGAGMDSTYLFTQVEHNLIYVSDNTHLKGMWFSTVDPYAAIDDNAGDGYGRELSSGVYFYLIQSGEHVQTRKMTLLR
jgi:hypothetical protein